MSLLAQGVITRQEFLDALTRQTKGGGVAHALTREQAESLFDDADADRSGEIDIDEFANTWEEMDASYGMQRMMMRKRSSRGGLVASAMAAVVPGARGSKGAQKGAATKAAGKDARRRV